MIEQVSTGIHWWLAEEVQQSQAGRNQVLDGYDKARRDYQLKPTDTGNVDAFKAAGHYSRFRLLMTLVNEVKPGNEYLVAKTIHHSLMFVSGGFRNQCFLQASDQADYEQRRFKDDRASGINMAQTVADALDNSSRYIALGGVVNLRDDSLRVNDQIFAAHGAVNEWFSKNPSRSQDALSDEDAPVQSALEIQRLGVGLAVSYIAVAAEVYGGLAEVPFLEPKSISDVSITPIYPYRPDA